MNLNKKQLQNFAQLTETMSRHNFSASEVVQLLQYSNQLHRWFEDFACGFVEIDDAGNAFRVVEIGNTTKRYPIKNKGKEIEKKIQKLIKGKNATYRTQQDPRGGSLYINNIPICL